MFCKIPVNKVQTYVDLRNVLMKRIFLSALHFRIKSIYKSSSPPFTSIELDHSDSGREGCTVTTLIVSAEPKSWQGAIKVATQEVRMLKEYGFTNGELARYLDALLKDSEQLAAMSDNISSVDNLDFVMESDALGHMVMDHKQSHESLIGVAGTITLEEVNFTGAQVLEYISDFGKAYAPVHAAIVACVPKKVHVDGVGEIDFKITPSEITAAIQEGLKEPIEPEPEFEVSTELRLWTCVLIGLGSLPITVLVYKDSWFSMLWEVVLDRGLDHFFWRGYLLIMERNQSLVLLFTLHHRCRHLLLSLTTLFCPLTRFWSILMSRFFLIMKPFTIYVVRPETRPGQKVTLKGKGIKTRNSYAKPGSSKKGQFLRCLCII